MPLASCPLHLEDTVWPLQLQFGGMTKLCKDCADALKGPFNAPMHLVHPEHSAAMVFDIYGVAMCLSCTAIWYRDQKGVVLLNERKPPKRAMPLPVIGRKSAKRVANGKPGRTR
jgi:hypothetical protein